MLCLVCKVDCLLWRLFFIHICAGHYVWDCQMGFWVIVASWGVKNKEGQTVPEFEWFNNSQNKIFCLGLQFCPHAWLWNIFQWNLSVSQSATSKWRDKTVPFPLSGSFCMLCWNSSLTFTVLVTVGCSMFIVLSSFTVHVFPFFTVLTPSFCVVSGTERNWLQFSSAVLFSSIFEQFSQAVSVLENSFGV